MALRQWGASHLQISISFWTPFNYENSFLKFYWTETTLSSILLVSKTTANVYSLPNAEVHVFSSLSHSSASSSSISWDILLWCVAGEMQGPEQVVTRCVTRTGGRLQLLPVAVSAPGLAQRRCPGQSWAKKQCLEDFLLASASCTSLNQPEAMLVWLPFYRRPMGAHNQLKPLELPRVTYHPAET